MNKTLAAKHWVRRTTILILFVSVLILAVGTVRNPDFWNRADRRGDALVRRNKFEEAAKTYTDPMRQGIAFYRAGNFEKAAKAFVRVPDAAGAFNQGNALLMHGAYDQAIAAFDRALGFRPGWAEAEENRALAVARRDRIKKQAGDQGADQEPDQIVVDLNAKHSDKKKANSSIEADKLSDEEVQATWLRRVQTTPGDFLRLKFAYQTQAKKEAGQKLPSEGKVPNR
jgi:Ca-activated chloride channel family protein